jgi:general secretion pathway protein H
MAGIFPIKARGFTLLELLIVLVVMGIMLAVAGPRIGKALTGLSIKTTARKVAAAMRYARSRAVSSGQAYNVVFDGEKRRVLVIQSPQTSMFDTVLSNNEADTDPPDNENEPESGNAQAQVREVKILPLPKGTSFHKVTVADVASDEGEVEEIYQLTFFPDGTTQQGEIILADIKERMYRIDVNFLTGGVTLAEQTDE